LSWKIFLTVWLLAIAVLDWPSSTEGKKRKLWVDRLFWGLVAYTMGSFFCGVLLFPGFTPLTSIAVGITAGLWSYREGMKASLHPSGEMKDIFIKLSIITSLSFLAFEILTPMGINPATTVFLCCIAGFLYFKRDSREVSKESQNKILNGRTMVERNMEKDIIERVFVIIGTVLLVIVHVVMVSFVIIYSIQV